MNLTPELLLHGYASGIFPMAEGRNDPEIFWVDPRRRGVMPLDAFHISRSLRRTMQRRPWTLRLNSAFDTVVEGCADRPETWINEEITELYRNLFDLGYAHSVEVWDGHTLVGGTYGVSLGAAWFGESMFSRATDASKVALAACVDRLRRAGFTLFDTQFLTAHLASLGGQEISRSAYQAQLREAVAQDADFTDPSEATLQDVVQRMTQTS